jgi:transcription elongation factor Elf1
LAISHPHLIEQWHPTKNDDLLPSEITSGCVKNVWWLGKCGHEWQSTVRNRTNPSPKKKIYAKYFGCPYCSNRLVNETNSLAFMFPEIAQEWHPTKNGDLLPENVNYRSYKKVWWFGKCGHEWETLIRTRTRKRSAGCPNCCESRGEVRIEKTLKELGVQFETQVRFPSCRDQRPLPFDFKIGNLLIEYQGQQHFSPINYGQKNYLEAFELIKKHDKTKKNWCLQNGYNLLEIGYNEFDKIPEILRKDGVPSHSV